MAKKCDTCGEGPIVVDEYGDEICLECGTWAGT